MSEPEYPAVLVTILAMSESGRWARTLKHTCSSIKLINQYSCRTPYQSIQALLSLLVAHHQGLQFLRMTVVNMLGQIRFVGG